MFAANMTGNIVFLGFAMAGTPEFNPLPYVVAIGGFLSGTLTALAISFRNATIRQLKVPDLTTTVLTLTLMGLLPIHRWRAGGNPNWLRRLGSVLAIFAGAVLGAFFLRHDGLTAALAWQACWSWVAQRSSPFTAPNAWQLIADLRELALSTASWDGLEHLVPLAASSGQRLSLHPEGGLALQEQARITLEESP